LYEEISWQLTGIFFVIAGLSFEAYFFERLEVKTIELNLLLMSRYY